MSHKSAPHEQGGSEQIGAQPTPDVAPPPQEERVLHSTADETDTPPKSRRRLLVQLWRRSPWFRLLFLWPLVVLGFFLLSSLPSAAHIEAEFTTRRFAVAIGGEGTHEVLNGSVPFSSLIIENCEAAALTPARLRLAEPQQATWLELPTDGRATFLCTDPAAKLTLQPSEPGEASLGVLDRIWLEPGSWLSFEVSEGDGIEITVTFSSVQRLVLPIYTDIDLLTEFVELEGFPLPDDALRFYQIQPSDSDRILEITGGRQGLTLIVEPTDTETFFRDDKPIPLEEIELLDWTPMGDTVSPVTAEGTIKSIDYPKCDLGSEIAVERGDSVAFGELGPFDLKSLRLDLASPSFVLRVAGEVAHIQVGSEKISSSLFRRLWCNQQLRLLAAVSAAIAVWIAAVVKAGNEIRAFLKNRDQ